MPRTNPRKTATTPKGAPSPRKGMRLHKIWLPDMDSPAFIAQARRESLAAARSAEETDLHAWMESVSILPLLPEYGDDL
jgi:hypothetical protein